MAATTNGSRRCRAVAYAARPAAASTSVQASPGPTKVMRRAGQQPTRTLATTTRSGRRPRARSGQNAPNRASRPGAGRGTGPRPAVGARSDAGPGGSARARRPPGGGARWRDRAGLGGRRAPARPGAGSTKRRVPPCSCGDPARDGQAEPGAAALVAGPPVPKRWNTRSRSSARRRARGRRPPATTAPGPARPAADPDRRVGGAVPPGVVEDVDQQLPEPGGVGRDDEAGVETRRRRTPVRPACGHLAHAAVTRSPRATSRGSG